MIDWTECPPSEVGMDPAGLDRALELMRARRAAAQLCVLRHGTVVLDRTIGCPPDALFLIFSTSKPFVALLVHLLAERGELSLDERVASYWPSFAQQGKGDITVRQVLQHRSGVPVARSVLLDALSMTDWSRSVRHLERARPAWPPGAVPAYHVLSYGFILGEIVRRVSGTPVAQFFDREFVEPLGLRDVHMGLPDRLWSRRVPVRGYGSAERLRQALFNRRATRRAVIPAAGVSASARDLARFYQALLRGGELDGVRILDRATIEQARQPSSDGEVDRLLNRPVRWSQGFQLGGPPLRADRARPMGRLSSPLTFGHNGSHCCLAWADPTRDLVFAYLTDLLPPEPEAGQHVSALSDAILAAVP